MLSWGSPPRGPKEEVVTCRTPPASRVQGFTCPFLSTEQVPLRGYVSFNSSDEQPLEGGSLCYRDVTSPINERDVESSSSSSRGALPQQARLGLGRGWGLLRRVRRGARVSEPVRGSVQTDRSRPWSGESLGASVCSFTACPAQCLGLPENRADEPCCVRRVRGPSSQHGAEATRWQAGRELGWAARCHGQACGSGAFVSLPSEEQAFSANPGVTRSSSSEGLARAPGLSSEASLESNEVTLPCPPLLAWRREGA